MRGIREITNLTPLSCVLHCSLLVASTTLSACGASQETQSSTPQPQAGAGIESVAAEPATSQARLEGLFLIRTTAKTPGEVIAALTEFSEAKEWKLGGTTKVKKGAVTLFKVCIPAVGKKVWPHGLHLSAMLPCGNVGVYSKDGVTEVSLLRARYMHVLVPTPEMEQIAAEAEPLLDEMLAAAL